jgi:biotin synthase
MKAENKELIDQLYQKQILSKEGFMKLIDQRDEETAAYLFAKARTVQKQIFGNTVYIRGIVEFSSYCRSNCLYCGIRRDNRKAERYRLSEEDILACCRQGHAFGFRTFVLQSGEDLFYTDEMLCHLIRSIKQEMPDSAITLSIGEKNKRTVSEVL